MVKTNFAKKWKSLQMFCPNLYFENYLLITLLVLTAILLKDIIITFFMLIKDFENCTLWTEPAIAPLAEWFKTTTLRKSYRFILLVVTVVCLNIFILLFFLLIETITRGLQNESVIAHFQKQFKTTSLRKANL